MAGLPGAAAGGVGGAAAAAEDAAALDPLCLDALRKLLLVREARLLKALGLVMRQAAPGGGGAFDVWMKQQSDLVQAAARAYAEREVMDACLRLLGDGGGANGGAAAGAAAVAPPAAAALLRPAVALYALGCLEADLAWFVSMEVVPPKAARLVAPQARRLVAALAPRAAALVAAFGIPDWLIAAPIAGDWADYNRFDNRGELLGEQFRQQ